MSEIRKLAIRYPQGKEPEKRHFKGPQVSEDRALYFSDRDQWANMLAYKETQHVFESCARDYRDLDDFWQSEYKYENRNKLNLYAVPFKTSNYFSQLFHQGLQQLIKHYDEFDLNQDDGNFVIGADFNEIYDEAISVYDGAIDGADPQNARSALHKLADLEKTNRLIALDLTLKLFLANFEDDVGLHETMKQGILKRVQGALIELLKFDDSELRNFDYLLQVKGAMVDHNKDPSLQIPRKPGFFDRFKRKIHLARNQNHRNHFRGAQASSKKRRWLRSSSANFGGIKANWERLEDWKARVFGT